MDNTADTSGVMVRPPFAWGLAVIAGLALNWLVPLPFLPACLSQSRFRPEEHLVERDRAG